MEGGQEVWVICGLDIAPVGRVPPLAHPPPWPTRPTRQLLHPPAPGIPEVGAELGIDHGGTDEHQTQVRARGQQLLELGGDMCGGEVLSTRRRRTSVD